MAIVKVISHGKNNAATRNILSYVLDTKKTVPELCGTLGDFETDNITPKQVYKEFQRVKNLFGKEHGGRTYIHGTVSWAAGEISGEEAADFAREYLPQIYPGHQILYAVHQDTDHVHFHFVTNTVSYLDGSMAHWSKHDLKAAKKLCNEMCQERGWQIPQKGHHHDGTAFEDGEITAWSKDKYHALIANPKQSYLVDAVIAIQNCTPYVQSREEFCAAMERDYGWKVVWEDKKKHITFINKNGQKVRDTNLSKTFNLNISKEGLLHEFERIVRKSTETASAEGANACPVPGAYADAAPIKRPAPAGENKINGAATTGIGGKETSSTADITAGKRPGRPAARRGR